MKRSVFALVMLAVFLLAAPALAKNSTEPFIAPDTLELDINRHPKTTMVNAGERAEFSVSGGSNRNLVFQWYKDGVKIPGATEPTLVFDPAMPSDSGGYFCLVTNIKSGQSRSENSNHAVLSVTVAPARPEISVSGTRSGYDNKLTEGKTYGASTPEQPNIAFEWVVDGGKILSGQGTNAIQFVPDVGVRSLILGCTATGTQSQAESASHTVSVFPVPDATVTITGGNPGYPEGYLTYGKSYTLSVPAKDGQTYSWRDPIGRTVNVASWIFTPGVDRHDEGKWRIRVDNGAGDLDLVEYDLLFYSLRPTPQLACAKGNEFLAGETYQVAIANMAAMPYRSVFAWSCDAASNAPPAGTETTWAFSSTELGAGTISCTSTNEAGDSSGAGSFGFTVYRAPAVQTGDAEQVTQSSAHIGMSVADAEWNAPISAYQFSYGTTSNLSDAQSVLGDDAELTNLAPDTTYYYRAVVTALGKVFTGEIKSFTTLPQTPTLLAPELIPDADSIPDPALAPDPEPDPVPDLEPDPALASDPESDPGLIPDPDPTSESVPET